MLQRAIRRATPLLSATCTMTSDAMAFLPPGTTLYFQDGIADAAGPVGVSLSNALKAVTP